MYVGLNIIPAGLLSTYRGDKGEESGITVGGGVLGLPGHFLIGIIFRCPESLFARLDCRFGTLTNQCSHTTLRHTDQADEQMTRLDGLNPRVSNHTAT